MKYFIISGTWNNNWIKFGVAFLAFLDGFTQKNPVGYVGICAGVSTLAKAGRIGWVLISPT